MAQSFPDSGASRPLRETFGERLRHWRERAGVSQAELGAELGYHHSLISRIESGDRWPPPGLADRCDTVLRTGGDLARLWPLVEDERRANCAHRRRAGNGAAGVPPAPAAAMYDLIPDLPPGRTHAQVAGALHTHYLAYERVMEDVGVSVVGPVIEGHVRRMLGWVDGADRNGAAVLLPVAARYGCLAGWAGFERGDYGRATAWLDGALGWAQAGGDLAYAGFLHTRIGVVALAQGDPGRSLARGRAALTTGGGRPWVAAFAAIVQARGYGMLGDQDACERQLELAEEQAARSDPADAPWWLLPPEGNLMLAGTQAACYRDLAVRKGRAELAEQAVAYAQRALDHAPAGKLPYRMLNYVRLADAYTCAGQLEIAVAAVEPVFTVPTSLWYAPVRGELRALWRRLAHRWPDRPEVHRFAERLRGTEAMPV